MLLHLYKLMQSSALHSAAQIMHDRHYLLFFNQQTISYLLQHKQKRLQCTVIPDTVNVFFCVSCIHFNNIKKEQAVFVLDEMHLFQSWKFWLLYLLFLFFVTGGSVICNFVCMLLEVRNCQFLFVCTMQYSPVALQK